ncbi:hypothetical protein OMP38_18695 [Cohnella ginsengisoli]|uniref:Uncharacterized protein n=1 Tax=Cohnella ginsengisoli TaxID=425004 RepID=A0A9X4KIY6_9BACL|nr:hypothetical protein [Cohnella ginsengisoli]MDG0792676.1 hypothetical protein [Cohnella ginsengisoli]
MATVHIVDATTIRIEATLEDAVFMIREAAAGLDEYASEIVTLFEKIPAFGFTFFCFYAYDSARLFEKMLGIDPKEYLSFSMDAPDAFFYALYGGMAALYGQAKRQTAPLAAE